MPKGTFRLGVLGFATLVCVHGAVASAFTAEEASKRDNALAWAAIQRLVVPAWELTEMDNGLMPSYRLFRTKNECMAQIANAAQAEIIASNCHQVRPHQKAKEFWSVLVVTDSTATKKYTEIRFGDHEACLAATAQVPLSGYPTYEGLCVNFETKNPPETGE